MEEFEKKDFSKILKHNALEGHRWMKNTDSSAVRVYDRNLQAFPLTIELYGNYARVVDYSDGGMGDEDRAVALDIISRFLYVEHERIIYRTRKKREGREQHEKDEDSSLRLDVRENGLLFECELMSYTDTGLFLDQAQTRARIMEIAGGMRVLNLFSYTGSFSVYAAAGGAESVVSVDLSNVYSEWCRRNLGKNGFLDEDKYRIVAGDALSYLEEAYERSERYDIVIFDPPAFSNSHKADDFDVSKDYLRYLYLISRVLSQGGVVLFSENLMGFRFEKGLLRPYWKIAEITDEVHALGFSGKRSGLRVWMLKKTADMKEMRWTAGRKKGMDEEKKEAERLSFDEAAAAGDEVRTERRGDERSERTGERRERRSFDRGGRRDDRRGYPRRDGGYGRRDDRRRDDRPYRDRDGYGRGSDRYASRERDRRYYDDRDRDYNRPRYRDDFRDHDRGYDRDRYSDRPRRDFRDRDYDRRDYGRRPYGDKENYRQRSSWSDRRNDDRGGYERRSRDWDNDTGRFYRSERGGSDGYREPRYSESGEDRRPFGDDRKRRRGGPKPYGYDSFMVTKNRDSADVFWLKNTEVKEDKDSN